MQCIGVIPARYASSRFPGKPLTWIGEKSMIRRVYEQANKAEKLSKVFVATDDSRIEEHVKEFGNVIMTCQNHQTGTERCGEVAKHLLQKKLVNSQDSIINIQGDEPFINPLQIDQLTEIVNNTNVSIATLAKKIKNKDIIFDENNVKVLLNNKHKAIYFSRTPLPHCFKTEKKQWAKISDYFCHVGIYGYKINILLELLKLPGANIENAESLEQLRWIYYEYDIHVGITEYDSYAVDVKEDIAKIPKELYM